MLTYDLSGVSGSLYSTIYQFIKNDISSGVLSSNEKLPSKRALADNLGVSTITIEKAYELLIDEGYIYSIPKRGYFVAEISGIDSVGTIQKSSLKIAVPHFENSQYYDFSSNDTRAESFPFDTWSKLMRETFSRRGSDLLKVSPCGGVPELRSAIAGHLSSFRGMAVDPDQIIIGAGTEYLYGLLIQLLGKNKVYCVENPGHKKICQIYKSSGVRCELADTDEKGISVTELRNTGAQIAHISPTHHFPTGITMPISRRFELLSWASECIDRYIIEDDYDSEFRLNGKPVPPLMSIDNLEKVIYMNTFSKSLTSTIRISYMVLPEHLANLFYSTLSFYSCTVSTFEQYTLAEFISRKYFERHINRMRLQYGRKRMQILSCVKEIFSENECRIIENDSGLHFILELNTSLGDRELCSALLSKNIKIKAITDFDMKKLPADKHQFILNYSGIDISGLKSALKEIKPLLSVDKIIRE